MPRPLILHIGASKTGTSALQSGLMRSRDSLAAQGVGMPFADRPEHTRALLRPLGWVVAQGFVRPPRPRGLQGATEKVAATPGDRLLVTNEDLCELDADRIDRLVGAFEAAGTEVRVVLSVRSLAAILPSEWQQFLKHRIADDYETFLTDVRERRGRWAEHFWQRQDVEAICRRWGDRVDGRVEVVITPDRKHDPTGLFRIFGDVVGYDQDTIDWPTKDVNASWGIVEAEVYRRINAELGDRLPRYESEYQPFVRSPLVRGALARSNSARITLPPEHLPWVQEESRRHVDHLVATGTTVHGDVQRLLPGPDAAAPLAAPGAEEVAAATLETLVNHLVLVAQQGARRPGAKPTPGPAAGAAEPSLRHLVGQVARRVVRR